MWIASKHGFFSIVKKGKTFEVRARRKQDLENLRRELKALKATETGKASVPEVLTTPTADYRWRLVLTPAQRVEVFDVLDNSIDYSNFKSMVQASADQRDKHADYNRIWTTMLDYQRDQEYPRRLAKDREGELLSYNDFMFGDRTFTEPEIAEGVGLFRTKASAAGKKIPKWAKKPVRDLTKTQIDQLFYGQREGSPFAWLSDQTFSKERNLAIYYRAFPSDFNTAGCPHDVEQIKTWMISEKPI